MNDEEEIYYKIVLLGSSYSGKTNLINRYVNNTFNNNSYYTISTDFVNKNVTLDNGEIINIYLWDTPGGERYISFNRIFTNKADGIILVYDISSRNSFEEIKYYLNCFKYNNTDKQLFVALVGNKIDIDYSNEYYERREVTTEEGQQYAEENNFLFYETSAKDGINVNECFDNLINRIYQNDANFQQKNIIKINKKRPPKRGCLK